MDAAQDLLDRYNACTTLNEKRELLNCTGAVGNDQLREQLMREMNEALENDGMLKLEDEVLNQTQNQAGKDLYIQAYYVPGAYETVLRMPRRIRTPTAAIAGIPTWCTWNRTKPAIGTNT